MAKVEMGMDEATRKKLIDDFMAREQEHLAKRMAARREAFVKELEGTGAHKEIVLRKIAILKLKEEMKQKRAAVSALRKEVRAIREQEKKAAEKTKATNKTQAKVA